MDYTPEINLTHEYVIDPRVLSNLTDREIVVDPQGAGRDPKLIPKYSDDNDSFVSVEGMSIFYDQNKILELAVPVVTKTDIRSINLPRFPTERSVVLPYRIARNIVRYGEGFLERRNIRHVLSPDMDTEDRTKSNEDVLYVTRLEAHN